MEKLKEEFYKIILKLMVSTAIIYLYFRNISPT